MSDELMELPKGWVYVTLDEIMKKIVDGTHHTPTYTTEGIPFISVKDIRDGKIHFDDCKYISLEEHEILCQRCRPETGDLLITKSGTIGRCAVVNTEKPFSLFVSVALLKPASKDILASYISFAFQSWFQTINVQNDVTGSTIKNFHLIDFRRLSLPLPPINEQKRIVAKIEELRERSQKAREALTAIPELCDKFRQSVLAAAFRGDLTVDWREQNPDVEPASVLLERIRRDRHQRWEELEVEKFKAKGETPKNSKWKDKYQAPLQINQDNFPDLPEGWCWISVEELVSDLPRSIQSGPFGSSLLHSEFQDTGVLAIGIDNVQDGYFTLGNENRISDEKYKELEKYTARSLDVLITVMATVGRCCVVPPDVETSIITKHVYRLSPEQKLVNSYFLMNALRGSEECLRQMYGHIRGQTRPGINGQILRTLAIPVPPRAEQEQILTAIQTQFNAMIRVSEILTELDMSMSSLDRSILAKAFRGELVEQDPNDEPASVLLERIRAEREQFGKSGKTSRKTNRKTKQLTMDLP